MISEIPEFVQNSKPQFDPQNGHIFREVMRVFIKALENLHIIDDLKFYTVTFNKSSVQRVSSHRFNNWIINSTDLSESRQLGTALNDLLTIPLPAPVFLVSLIFLAFLTQYYWLSVLNIISQASASSGVGNSVKSVSFQDSQSVLLADSFIIPKGDLILALQQVAHSDLYYHNSTEQVGGSDKANQSTESTGGSDISLSSSQTGSGASGRPTRSTKPGMGFSHSSKTPVESTSSAFTTDASQGTSVIDTITIKSSTKESSHGSSTMQSSTESADGQTSSKSQQTLSTNISSSANLFGSSTSDQSQASMQIVTPASRPTYMNMLMKNQGVMPWR